MNVILSQTSMASGHLTDLTVTESSSLVDFNADFGGGYVASFRKQKREEKKKTQYYKGE